MEVRKATPVEIRKRGLEALAKALGPVGMALFLDQFGTGSGDYTRDREQWLENIPVQETVKEIKQRRGKGRG